MARLWFLLAAFGLLFVGFEIASTHAIAWDEIEYFRATRWVAEGRVPYRDFWEHHSPLQWLVFAPVAKLIGNGPGVAAIVAMRIAQLPFWFLLFAALDAIARRAGAGLTARTCALALLLLAPAFVGGAVEYRLDLLGNCGFIVGLLLMLRGWEKRSVAPWIWAGAAMSLAVLANMRLAPLVVFTAALAFCCDPQQRRWTWNLRSLAMAGGVLPIAAAFVGWLFMVGAWPSFVEDVFRCNSVMNRLVGAVAPPFTKELFAPLRARDVSAVALWMVGIAGTLLLARTIRRPGVEHVVAILFAASVAAVASLGVHYPYHFLTTYLLMAVVASVLLDRLFRDERRGPAARFVAAAVAVAALLLDGAAVARAERHAAMKYHDVVMREVHRRTRPGDLVWDGVGYALHRQPAYRYWFLPSGLRLMAKEGLVEPYDLPQLRASPPAAIIYNGRLHLWLLAFPRLQRHVVHHYVPLYRHLWIPGLSGIAERGRRLRWRAVADGEYEVWASELLSRHPWFSRPLDYALLEGQRAKQMEIPLAALPPFDHAALQWSVDGRLLPRGTRVLRLTKNAVVELVAESPHPTGVIVVPRGTTYLCRSPEHRVFF